MHIPNGVKKRFTAMLILGTCQMLLAASPRILIDGRFDDWSGQADLWTSSATDSDGNVTFQTLKASNDDNFLFIYFKTAETFSLQEDYALKLYVDTDNNSSTGLSVDGIGADIEFTFNQRSGVMHLSSNTSISFSDLFMVTAPTVWSDEYEFSISRHTESPSGQPVFTAPSVRFLMKDESVSSLHASKTSAVTYTFASEAPEPLPAYSLQKKNADYLRTLSHNVEFDGFFESENLSAYERLYGVINPDIIGFSEIYNHSDEDLSARLEAILPSPQGKSWNAAHVYDNFLATRYTILGQYACGGYGNGAFYLDLRPDYQANALVIVGHPPCCSSNDAYRSDEIDAIAAFIRDAKAPGGNLTLPENTPILILGDMNLVGNPHQWTTLLTGDIDDEARFGPDFTPDWDNSVFEDAMPYVTGLPMAFTQGVGTYPGSYAKGRLDVTLYSGSVLDLKNSFVLYTNALPVDSLNMYQLQSDDTESVSDHFPLVSDFQVSIDQNYTISDIRINDNTGIPVFLNQVVTVTGIVTSSDAFGSSGPASMQDDHAGISIYGTNLVSQLNTGDVITITSPVGFFRGLTQFVYQAGISNITVHENVTLPSPTIVSIPDILNQAWDGFEALEGMLIRVNHVAFVNQGDFAAATNYSVTDGEYTLDVRIDDQVDLVGTPIPTGEVSITGILSQFDSSSPYSSGYQLLPRSLDDIVPSEPLEGFMLLSPEPSASLSNQTPVFKWRSLPKTDSMDTIRYTLFLDCPDPGVRKFQAGTDTVYTLDENLSDNTQYFWKVSARNTEGNTWDNFGGYRSFIINTGNENPSVPHPLTPDSVIVLTLKPKFIWTPSTDPDPGDYITYQMILRSKTSSVTITSDSNSCKVVEALKDNDEYTWYVKALDTHSGYSLSTSATFWTDLFPEPPVPFNTIHPGDGERVNEPIVTLIWQNAVDPDPLDYSTYTVKFKSTHPDSVVWHEIDVGTDTSLTLNLTTGNRYEWQVIAKDDDGHEVISNRGELSGFDVGDVAGLESNGVPQDFFLSQNFPNPFNPVTTIQYGLPEISDVTLTIYDISGRIVSQWFIPRQQAGRHDVIWDGTNRQGHPISTGMYLYSLKAGDFREIKKMVFMK
ncbi:MAG: hypothetical protein DRP86_06185 [Candidatus Neomarinimicrobiota bacterium]|nr:MAG: hypothetical protein DRP86_06185 [Candidatus Neomarinimicrobiota bacterium]